MAGYHLKLLLLQDLHETFCHGQVKGGDVKQELGKSRVRTRSRAGAGAGAGAGAELGAVL
eukprot:461863-Hanusia_phi.AAC.2